MARKMSSQPQSQSQSQPQPQPRPQESPSLAATTITTKTPQLGFIRPPPTPPRTSSPPTDEKTRAIVNEIYARRDGTSSSTAPWAAWHLNIIDYETLRRQLSEDKLLQAFVKNRLRCDYFPYAQRFVLRMPTILHERFINAVVENIVAQLKVIENTNPNTPHPEPASSIVSTGSSTIKFPDPDYGSHQPDASFRHLQAPYAGVLFEVSYSQKRKDIPRLADEYILGSDGEIRVVVGLDIEYQGTRQATISVWRPQFSRNDRGEEELVVQQTIANQPFRSDSGEVVTEGDLRLELQDFAPDGLGLGRSDHLHIAAADLVRYLEQAELVHAVDTKPKAQKPGLRKRRRDSTPPEELLAAREMAFQEDEQRAAKRAQLNDSSFSASTVSDTESG